MMFTKHNLLSKSGWRKQWKCDKCENRQNRALCVHTAHTTTHLRSVLLFFCILCFVKFIYVYIVKTIEEKYRSLFNSKQVLLI